MNWLMLRVDSTFPSRPLLEDLTPAERWVMFELVLACVRYSTGGVLPPRSRWPLRATDRLVAKLEGLGLLERSGDVLTVRGYLQDGERVARWHP